MQMRNLAGNVGAALVLGLACWVPPAEAALEESVVKLCATAWQAIDPDGDTFTDNALVELGLAAARKCEADGHPLGAASVANMLYRAGKVDEANRAIDRAIASGRELGAAYQQRCVIGSTQGAAQEAAALAACNEAMWLEPDWYAPYLTRGFIHYNAKRYAEAERDWRAGIAREPRSAPLWQNLGLALASQDRHAEALDQHLEARRIAPRHAGPLVNVPLTLERLGRHQEALSAFNDAARILPEASVLIPLAAYHERRRQPDLAIEADGRVIASEPRNVGALRARGRLHEAATRYEAARDDYARVAALEPQSLEAALDLTRVIVLGPASEEEARAALTKAAEISDAEGSADSFRKFFQGMSRILREGQNWTGLAEISTIYLTEVPEEIGGWTQRGLARRNLGDYAGAIEDETQALAIEPTRTHSLFWRAQSHTALGNWEAAEADYSRLLSLDPKYVWAWNNRGTVRAKLDRAQDSYRDFEQFLALYPGRVSMNWEYWAAAGRAAGVPAEKMLATLNARAPTTADDAVQAARDILAGKPVSKAQYGEEYEDYDDWCEYMDC